MLPAKDKMIHLPSNKTSIYVQRSTKMKVTQDLLDSHGNNGDGNIDQGCLQLLSLPNNRPTPTTECLSDICKVQMKTCSELLKMNER